MKLKTMSVLFMMVGVSFILSGGIVQLILFNETLNLNEAKERILTDYEVFRVKYDKFYDVRSEVYDEVIDNDINNIANNYYEMTKKLDEYTEVVKEVEDVSQNLKEETPKMASISGDDDVKNKSEAFLFNYRQMINYFNSDIEKFNEEVKMYNKSKGQELLKEYEPDTIVEK